MPGAAQPAVKAVQLERACLGVGGGACTRSSWECLPLHPLINRQGLWSLHYPPPWNLQEAKGQTESEENPEPDFVGALVPDFRSQAPAWPGSRAPAVLWEGKKNLFLN